MQSRSARPSGFGGVLRAPALRFTLAGILAFALSTRLPPRLLGQGPSPSREIVVDADRIAGLKRDYSLSNRKAPSETETMALVEAMVDEEIFFREALARGFEHGDRPVTWRLVQKVRFLGEDRGEDLTTLARKALKMGLHRSDPVVRRILVEKIRLVVGGTAPRPGERELVDWYQAHAEDYRQPERITLRQVFFDRQRRGGEDARQAAVEAAARAVNGGEEIAGALAGDPFVVGGELRSQARSDLRKLFGAAFVDSLFALPVGAWQGPVESAYGWHVVFVRQRFDARIPDLVEVRSRVVKAMENEARERRIREFLEQARTQYGVRIDRAALFGGGDG